VLIVSCKLLSRKVLCVAPTNTVSRTHHQKKKRESHQENESPLQAHPFPHLSKKRTRPSLHHRQLQLSRCLLMIGNDRPKCPSMLVSSFCYLCTILFFYSYHCFSIPSDVIEVNTNWQEDNCEVLVFLTNNMICVQKNTTCHGFYKGSTVIVDKTVKFDKSIQNCQFDKIYKITLF
jgi:hypothetical protein